MCTHVCQNGGICSAPDNCTCSSGWTGSTCKEGLWQNACVWWGSKLVFLKQNNLIFSLQDEDKEHSHWSLTNIWHWSHYVKNGVHVNVAIMFRLTHYTLRNIDKDCHSNFDIHVILVEGVNEITLVLGGTDQLTEKAVCKSTPLKWTIPMWVKTGLDPICTFHRWPQTRLKLV